MKTGKIEKRTDKKSYLNWLIGAGLLIVGLCIGWFWRKHLEATLAQTKLIRENSHNYKFINPIILAQVPENTSNATLQMLKKSITAYITNAKAKNSTLDASIYFRQMNTDSWIGVNADDTYAPASMLKAVSLIAFLRAEQQDPTIATQNIEIAKDSINTDSNQDYYPPTQTVQAGQPYSADDLVSHMIMYSDNNAAFALDDITGKTLLAQTYADLAIPDPDTTAAIDFMSPKMFSRVFRTLYNGAYLSYPVSEQALELLSKTTFTQGLVAGVPAGTVVSHKFGERTIGITDANNPSNSQTTHELHDCGIIYAQNDPYLLCIMTKGADFPVLQGVISDISAMTWKSVEQMDAK